MFSSLPLELDGDSINCQHVLGPASIMVPQSLCSVWKGRLTELVSVQSHSHTEGQKCPAVTLAAQLPFSWQSVDNFSLILKYSFRRIKKNNLLGCNSGLEGT